MAIMVFRNFQRSWYETHPHERVVRVQVSRSNWWAIVSIFVGLIAVNILSAAHTIPVIATTVATDVDTIKVAVGVSAFFAIEFTMFIMMVLTIEHYLRYFVIFLALIVAIVANVASTVKAVEASEYAMGGQIVGIVLGLFAPLANLAAGEMLRSVIKQSNERVERANTDYEARLKNLDNRIRAQYVSYLHKVGITDPTQIMELMGNEDSGLSIAAKSSAGMADTNSTVTGTEGYSNLPDSNAVGVLNTGKSSDGLLVDKVTAASKLAERIRQDGTFDLSYNELRQRYGGSPNTIRQAKQILEQ